MELPTQFITARLTLRKPELADAPAIFTAYAQDPEVTRFLVWRPHPDIATTQAYIEHCLSTWKDTAGESLLSGLLLAGRERKTSKRGLSRARTWRFC